MPKSAANCWARPEDREPTAAGTWSLSRSRSATKLRAMRPAPRMPQRIGGCAVSTFASNVMRPSVARPPGPGGGGGPGGPAGGLAGHDTVTAMSESASMATDDRPVVAVANRLPVQHGEDGWELSPGGLVTALRPVMSTHSGAWVGWDGGTKGMPATLPDSGVLLKPVSLSSSQVRNYYYGFSNATLWPPLHYALQKT